MFTFIQSLKHACTERFTPSSALFTAELSQCICNFTWNTQPIIFLVAELLHEHIFHCVAHAMRTKPVALALEGLNTRKYTLLVISRSDDEIRVVVRLRRRFTNGAALSFGHFWM